MTPLRARMTLVTLFFVTLFGISGLALPYPILAPLFEQGQAQLTQFAQVPPKILLGLLLAVYPLGIVLGSSFLGSKSDIYGRKKVLLASTAVAILGYLLSAWAIYIDNYPLLFVSRFITGLSEGNVSIARAMVADLDKYLDKTRAFSLLNSAIYGGYLVGALAGGALATFGYAIPFVMAALILSVTLGMIAWVLEENPQLPNAQKTHKGENSLTLLKDLSIRRAFYSYLFLSFGLNAFYEFYPLWLAEYHAFDSLDIGLITMLQTSFMILMASLLNNSLKQRLGIKRGIRASVGILALSLAILPFSQGMSMWVLFAIQGVVIALYNALYTLFMSDTYGNKQQGKVMGLMTTTFCLANVLVALIGSLVSVLDTLWVFWLGSASLVLGILLFSPAKPDSTQVMSHPTSA